MTHWSFLFLLQPVHHFVFSRILFILLRCISLLSCGCSYYYYSLGISFLCSYFPFLFTLYLLIYSYSIFLISHIDLIKEATLGTWCSIFFDLYFLKFLILLFHPFFLLFALLLFSNFLSWMPSVFVSFFLVFW